MRFFYNLFTTLLIITVCLRSTGFAQIFTEESQEMGINHVQFGSKLMGGGIACFDYNNDGWIDIYMTGGLYPDKLYKNNGAGQFNDVASEIGITKPDGVISMGVTTGDVDNDGIGEIFISTDEKEPNLFYKSFDGGKTYLEVAFDVGLDKATWSMGAVFLDVNRDGYLDLYVINYLSGIAFDLKEGTNDVIGYNPSCLPDYLYMNDGNGNFTNVSSDISEGRYGCGLAVTSTDFDNDRDSDIYIANDFGIWSGYPNALLENNGSSMNWSDVAAESGTNAAIYGMGIAVGDYNNDLLLDYYVTNLGRNVLFKNNGNGTFDDVSTYANVENTKVTDRFTTGWGTVFMDYDNDTYLDLFVANGHIPTIGAPTANTVEDPNKLFRNNRDGTFEDVSDLEGFNHTGRQRGLAFADLDNDGDMDLIAASVTRDDPPSDKVLVHKNHTDPNNHWLKISLTGTESNRDAYGTHIFLYKDQKVWMREINGGSSHTSQNSSVVHFGLENYSNIDSLVVKWPSGLNQHFTDIEANQVLNLTEQVELVYDVASCDNAMVDIRIENFRNNFRYQAQNELGEVLAEASNSNEEYLNIKVTGLQSVNDVSIVCLPIDHTYENRLKIDSFSPEIERGIGNKLGLPNGVNYKWFFNGEVLSETSQIHNATIPGIYHGEFENEYGCTIRTQDFILKEEDIITSVYQQTKIQVSVFPNPSNGDIYIDLAEQADSFSYTVFSMTGQAFDLSKYQRLTASSIKINLNGLTTGVYLIQINTNKGSNSKRVFIK